MKAGWAYMKEQGILDVIIHAPYIINLGNSVKQETYNLAVEFLEKEIEAYESPWEAKFWSFTQAPMWERGWKPAWPKL